MNDIGTDIWDLKYRFKHLDGTVVDVTRSDTNRRVARALASVEPESFRVWEEQFFAVLESGEFIPAGRIIGGAGTERNVTLLNCFTMGTIPDSMGGIFDNLKEAALTMQAGGGIGYDFSTLRPKGAPVKGVGADASGPISFMHVWDAMCRTVMSAGSRRGAMMATMRCDHPDIEEFVTVKADPTKLRMFNLSVLVTDAFMEAVKEDAPWLLHWTDRHGSYHVHKELRARDLWNLILRNTYAHAEPGVIFVDRINRLHNLNYLPDRRIATTNPCGEQPMPPYSSCLLGSVNLVHLVERPFTDRARMNKTRLDAVVKLAIRMMDNVVDVSRFPLEKQAEVAKRERRLGLGITGLGDTLAMLGLVYGSPEAQQFTRDLMRRIAREAYMASVELAVEKGPFPDFDADGYLGADTWAGTKLAPDVQERIRKHGIRNALLTSIAPTGTISLYAGNVSSGIEPIFAFDYKRKILQPDGSKVEATVEDWAVAKFRSVFGQTSPLPASFVTAQTLTPRDHVVMQAAAQEWVDSSISKTVNVPEDISYEDFVAVYDLAWESGCKGCTTYRPNPVTGSILTVTPEPTVEQRETEALGAQSEELLEAADLAGLARHELDPPEVTDEQFARMRVVTPAERLARQALAKRPRTLQGETTKIKMGGEDAVYVTITDVEEDGRRRPFEIFVNTKNPNHYAWTTALTRMVSAIFRRPWDSSFVAQELKEVFDPNGGGFLEGGGGRVNSIPAAIGKVIEDHMKAIGYWPSRTPTVEALAPIMDGMVELMIRAPACPSCKGHNMDMTGSCPRCLDCGFSKCG